VRVAQPAPKQTNPVPEDAPARASAGPRPVATTSWKAAITSGAPASATPVTLATTGARGDGTLAPYGVPMGPLPQ